jgi:cytochrome bd ubiquinol oxidase subunit I
VLLPSEDMLDLLTLARAQFAVTTIYHFLFVPLTLGLSIFIAVFETLGYIKEDDHYTKLALFMGKLFIINFAMGVVTGIVQEFQFGMNWAEYSRFVGDIFGAPLAIEALAAFFMESTFLGVWIFGRDKLPRKLHIASIWLVAFASNLSAYWILVANSFMQEPVGYVLRNGRAEMNDFIALIINPHVLLQYPHVAFSGLTTAAVFIIGVCAYKLIKKSNVEVFAKGLRFGAYAALISVIAVSLFGDFQGKYLVKHQPMKMAAAEAIWETQEPASLSVFSVIDENSKKNTFEIAIPKMLSFMSYSNFTGKVYGINDLQKEMEREFGPGNYIPPVSLSYWSFRIMAGFAMVLILAALIAIWFLWRKKISEAGWLLKALVVIIPVPYICNAFGWILTEMGRQPWIVYKVLKTDEAVSKSVSPGMVLTSLIGFTLIYGVLAVIDVYLLVKFAKKDVKEVEA